MSVVGRVVGVASAVAAPVVVGGGDQMRRVVRVLGDRGLVLGLSPSLEVRVGEVEAVLVHPHVRVAVDRTAGDGGRLGVGRDLRSAASTGCGSSAWRAKPERSRCWIGARAAIPVAFAASSAPPTPATAIIAARSPRTVAEKKKRAHISLSRVVESRLGAGQSWHRPERLARYATRGPARKSPALAAIAPGRAWSAPGVRQQPAHAVRAPVIILGRDGRRRRRALGVVAVALAAVVASSRPPARRPPGSRGRPSTGSASASTSA